MPINVSLLPNCGLFRFWDIKRKCKRRHSLTHSFETCVKVHHWAKEWGIPINKYFNHPTHSSIIIRFILTTRCTCIEILYKPSLPPPYTSVDYSLLGCHKEFCYYCNLHLFANILFSWCIILSHCIFLLL